jgi:hypothetical protein
MRTNITSMTQDATLLWAAHHFIYAWFAATGAPPTIEQTTRQLGITSGAVAALYRELDARHAIVLEPGTEQVRMANPFSAVPTPFTVVAEDITYWANCAWDAFGIPAALHADADIMTWDAFDGTPLRLQARGTTFSGDAGLVHFPLPCRRWYDDLVFT